MKMRVVPRAPGDTTPLDPAIAEALRKAGIDPTKYTTVRDDSADPLAGAPKPGARLLHSFRFLQLGDALTALERLLDAQTEARISRLSDGWLVVFDAPVDASIDDVAAHQRFASLGRELGAEDRGVMRETVSVKVNQVTK
jgi:hypothetical protein